MEPFLNNFEKYIQIEEEVTLPIDIFILDSFKYHPHYPIYCQQTETKIFLSPLILAAGYGLQDMVSMILDATRVDGDSQPDAVPDHGTITALFLALCCGNAKIAKVLLRMGAKPDASLSVNALHAAARGGVRSTIIQLVEVFGVDPNVEDHDGATPVFYALLLPEKEAFETISLLHRLGARTDMLIGDHHWGLTAMAKAMGKDSLVLELERNGLVPSVQQLQCGIIIVGLLYRIILDKMIWQYTT